MQNMLLIDALKQHRERNGGIILENLIRSVIEADREARMRVEKAKKDRYNIQSLISDKQKEIEAAYQEESKQKLTEVKAKFDALLKAEEDKQKASYEQQLQRLAKTYESHKDEWVKEIVKNTLEA